MTRNLKALGLALFAAFAMSAVAAASASAVSDHFKLNGVTGKTGKLMSKVIGAKGIVFNTNIGPLQCTEFEVSEAEKYSYEEVQTQLTVGPLYTKCFKINEAGEETTKKFYDPMSCDTLFTGETKETNGDGKLHAEVHIVCDTPGDEITTQATELKLACLDIPEQTLWGVRYKNTETPNSETHVDVGTTIKGIKYTKTGVCGSGTREDGTLEGEVTVTGTKGNKENTGVSVTET